MLKFITTFSEDGYAKYARKMLEGVKENWGEGLHLTAFYHDFDIADYDYPVSDNITYRNLNDIEDLHVFRKEHKDHDGTMGKKVPYNWRVDAIKFCHKVFGLTEMAFELAEESKRSGWLIWLDADTYTTKPITDKNFIPHLNPKSELVYLDRKNFEFAETSFMAFNLDYRPPLDLLGDLRGFYMSGEVTTYREWHDGFVISRLINLYRAHGLKVVDLTGHMDEISSHLTGPQAFDSSFLGNIMIHQKGEKKHSESGNPDPRSNMRYKKLGDILQYVAPKKIVEVGEWDSHRAIGSCTKSFEKNKSISYILFNDFKNINFSKSEKLFNSYKEERESKGLEFTFKFIKGEIDPELVKDADYAFIGGFDEPEQFTDAFNKLKHTPLIVIDKIYTADKDKKLPNEKYLKPVKTLEEFKATKKYILPSEDDVTGGGRCHIAVVINKGSIDALPRELLQVPIIVNPKDCVPKEDIMDNVKNNMKLIPTKHWVDKTRNTKDVGIIVSGGPSTDWDELRSVIKEEEKNGAKARIMAVKHSYPTLLKQGFIPWGCTILDPRSLEGKSTHGIVRRTLFKTISKETLFFIASMTEPSVTRYLLKKKAKLIGWHAYTQALQKNIEEQKNAAQSGNKAKLIVEKDLGIEEGATLITGGTCAAMRTIGIMHTLGFRKFHLFGFDCNVSEPSKKNLSELSEEGAPKFMQVSVDDHPFWTTGELLAMAQDCEKIFERDDVDLDLEFHGKETLVAALWNKSISQKKITYQELLDIGD
jgi:hypothetical protein|tara:strand:- start:2289 stop:4568 length:2280 start_codon:yes stop_codon:yes gene_type:complete